MSTTTYTLMSVVFIHVLISKFHLIAGYGLNQLLFFNLLGQVAYFSTNGFFKPSIDLFITSVKKGNLDFTLLRPVPSLFYVSFRKIPLVSTFRDSLNVLIYIFIIDWKALNLHPYNFLIGFLILILGIITWHCVMFILSFAVFWFGESKRIFFLNQSVADGDGSIPYEGFPKNLRFFLTFIIPSLLVCPLPVSVALSKASPNWIYWSIICASIFIFLKKWVWTKGLKAYTSAS